MVLLSGHRRVVFAGDGNLAARDGFVGCLDAWVRLHGPEGVEFIPAALPGSLLKDYLRRFERDVFPLKPDLLVVVPGTTDILFSGDGKTGRIVEAAEELLDELCGLMEEDGLVFTSTLLFSDDPGFFQNESAREFNGRLSEACGRRGVEYWDLFTPLMEALERLHPTRLTVDGMTLSPLGHLLLFAETARRLGVRLDRDRE